MIAKLETDDVFSLEGGEGGACYRLSVKETGAIYLFILMGGERMS